MLDQVEVTVAEQSLPRLQAVGSADTVFAFLYELSWGPRESFSPARLRGYGPQGPAIRLLPGAGDELLRLGPLVRPLVELHWTRMVAEINKVASAELDLQRHLFGSERVIPPRALRDGVVALQDGRCFYCGGTLGAAEAREQPQRRVLPPDAAPIPGPRPPLLAGEPAMVRVVLRRTGRRRTHLHPAPVHPAAGPAHLIQARARPPAPPA